MGILKFGFVLVAALAGLSVRAGDKSEVVIVKYELTHDVCEKGKCKQQLLTKGTESLSLERETDNHFWKYKPVSYVKDFLDVQIRFKAVFLKNKNDKRTFELGFAERKKDDMQQISWGEATLEGSSWPVGNSLKVLGTSYDLNGKTIVPSVKIEFIKN